MTATTAVVAFSFLACAYMPRESLVVIVLLLVLSILWRSL